MKGGEVVALGDPTTVVTEELVRTVFGLESRVIPDPVSGTPLIIPIGRHHATGRGINHALVAVLLVNDVLVGGHFPGEAFTEGALDADDGIQAQELDGHRVLLVRAVEPHPGDVAVLFEQDVIGVHHEGLSFQNRTGFSLV